MELAASGDLFDRLVEKAEVAELERKQKQKQVCGYG